MAIVPNFIKARASGMGRCKNNLHNFATGLEMYAADHGGRYPTSLESLVPKYLQTLPDCPEAQRFTYSASFGPFAPWNNAKASHYFFLQCDAWEDGKNGHDGRSQGYSSVEGLIERKP